MYSGIIFENAPDFFIQKKIDNAANLLKWAKRDSNPRPPGCKPGALNQLSYSPELRVQMYNILFIVQHLFEKKSIVAKKNRVCYQNETKS